MTKSLKLKLGIESKPQTTDHKTRKVAQIIMKTFTSTTDSLAIHNGPVEIIRPLTEQEADIDDVGPMFKCRSPQGEFDAFEDELTDS